MKKFQPSRCGVLFLVYINEPLCGSLSFFFIHVNNGNVGTRCNQCLCHDQAQTSSSTSDDGYLALHGKRGQCALRVLASTAYDGIRRWQVLLFWVLYDNVVPSSRVLALVVATLARLA